MNWIIIIALVLTGCTRAAWEQSVYGFAGGYAAGSALYYQQPRPVICTQICNGPICTTVCQ